MPQKDEAIKMLYIPDLVNSPYQGRLYEITGELPPEDENDIIDLKDSIVENGLLQPIIVRPLDNGKYEIIDGHRRVIAYRRQGWGHIKAIVKEYDDRKAQIFSVIGNLQRKDLHPIENAFALQKILKSGIIKDQKELAQAIGKDQTYVGDVLNILKMDPRLIDELIKSNAINDVRMLRIIRTKAPLEENGFSDFQLALYHTVVEKGLNRRQLINHINKITQVNQKQSVQRITYENKSGKINVKFNVKDLKESQIRKIEKIIKNDLENINQKIEKIINEKK
jgi:ParB/RepB/Spo0J family partition protein